MIWVFPIDRGTSRVILDDAWARVVGASYQLALISPTFVAISYAIKRWQAIRDGRRALSEIRLNVIYLMLDAALVIPIIAVVADTAQRTVLSANMRLFEPADYEGIPAIIVVLLVVLIIDLTGYWRHRLMHTWWLWPAHAIHHSDTEVTWLALARFHPINRLITTGIHASVLAMLGAPAWALLWVFRARGHSTNLRALALRLRQSHHASMASCSRRV
jgi:sterol desaturase/sphingolipid hydroxylase (fatty acid hydroxylase superfamily)